MTSGNPFILFAFLLYLAGMLAIGLFFFRRTVNLPDYILGGRRLNSWVTAMSAQASDMSGWLLLGLPGYAYLVGLESVWIALGLAVGTYLNWRFVARPLRMKTEEANNSITIPDYLENRFGDSTRSLRIVSALFILVFFLIYTASGFVAGAKLFSTVFGLSYMTGLMIGMTVIISYTFLGGFMAVSWTDFFQALIMVIAIIIVPVLGIIKAGGIIPALETLASINTELTDAFTAVDGSSLSLISVVSLCAWGLGYFGQPHILARFMAIRTTAHIPRARKIAMIWVIFSLTFAVLVGMVGRILLGDSLVQGTSETVFMVMVESLVPSLLAGFLLAAILAAIMSTADSQLLVTSSAITEDFYRVFLRRKAGDRELVWVGRGTVIAVAIAACILAYNPESSVLKLVAYAWGGFGATFGPVIILSLYWRGITRLGALAGLITGGITVLVWKHLSGGIFELYEIVPGFVLSFAAIVAISLLETFQEN